MYFLSAVFTGKICQIKIAPQDTSDLVITERTKIWEWLTASKEPYPRG